MRSTSVLANNAAYAALCPGLVAGGNVLRQVFLTPACCNAYAGQAKHLARMVGYLRSAYGKNLDDPTWTEFIDDLVDGSAVFAALWARNDVAVPVDRTKVIRNVITGDIEMFMTSMSMPTIAGAWVQILTPVDEDGWARLRALLAMSEQERIGKWREHTQRYHSDHVESGTPVAATF